MQHGIARRWHGVAILIAMAMALTSCGNSAGEAGSASAKTGSAANPAERVMQATFAGTQHRFDSFTGLPNRFRNNALSLGAVRAVATSTEDRTDSIAHALQNGPLLKLHLRGVDLAAMSPPQSLRAGDTAAQFQIELRHEGTAYYSGGVPGEQSDDWVFHLDSIDKQTVSGRFEGTVAAPMGGAALKISEGRFSVRVQGLE